MTLPSAIATAIAIAVTTGAGGYLVGQASATAVAFCEQPPSFVSKPDVPPGAPSKMSQFRNPSFTPGQ